MKIVIAPDKFKHTLSAQQVSDAISEGINKLESHSEIIKIPLADGGEGTAEILAPFFNAKPIKVKVHNPICNLIDANYYFSDKNKTAIIELSEASGLQLLKTYEQNPLYTSTYGTGEMICDAVSKCSKTIFLSLGGSATNDAACGAAQALGYKFYDKTGKELNITGHNLRDIHTIDDSDLKVNFEEIKVLSLYDVTNNLYGKNGAAFIYAKQKGADSKEIRLLNKGLKQIAKVIQKKYSININNCSGCGSAGGFGGGSKVFFNAELKAGAETVLKITDFENKIKNADLIITGEGKFDKQSFNGKLTGTIIETAKKHKIPVIVICGISEVKQNSSFKIYPLFEKFPGNEYAIKHSEKRLTEIIKEIFQTN